MAGRSLAFHVLMQNTSLWILRKSLPKGHLLVGLTTYSPIKVQHLGTTSMTTLGTTFLNFDALLYLIIFFRYVQLIFLKKLLWPFLNPYFLCFYQVFWKFLILNLWLCLPYNISYCRRYKILWKYLIFIIRISQNNWFIL